MTDASPPPPSGDNSQSRYEIVRDKMARLSAIKEEQAALTKEANGIIDELEKDSGVNRGALAEIRRLDKLSAAAIQAREASRQELFTWMVAPRLEEAAKGEEGE